MDSPTTRSRLEIWAGIECTVNRVGDRFHDQLELNGHDRRETDIQAFHELGIHAIRYPLLWERCASAASAEPDWTWSDRRMRQLQDCKLRPIVGLIHHGSGPPHTDLLSADFAPGLAEYAGRVAERYPWVCDYTPVNEPLTTARFSGLYGHWHPHQRSDHAFARALVNQCRAVVLAMQAIRRVQPAARLIQTEDLAKVHSTSKLRYQADFENERRWLTADLLTGQLTCEHRMWHYLVDAGIPARELAWFQETPCAPHMLGANYYLTSERYLDHRTDRYPAHRIGGNGRHRYADVEAVRARTEGMEGFGGLLRELWERCRRPIAVTEAHLGCSRMDQIRWLHEAWQAAHDLRREAIDVRAVTTWALLGSFGWDRLVTESGGHYEPGAFDVRSAPPRPTAIAHLVRELAADREPSHPVLRSQGWWRRPGRLIYNCNSPAGHARSPADSSLACQDSQGQPLLITGKRGTLGDAFVRICAGRGLPHVCCAREDFDIAEPASVARALEQWRPWAVVNAAGYRRIDRAEQEPGRCHRDNVCGALTLARVCAVYDIPLLTFSSHMVFDGRKHAPYIETDEMEPLNVYGRSKTLAERRVKGVLSRALIVRTSGLFGPWDEGNFAVQVLRRVANKRPVAAASDLTISVTYVPDLVNLCLDLLVDGETGIWHLSNTGSVTWAQFAQEAAEVARQDAGLVTPTSATALGFAARRPPFSALGSARGSMLSDFHDALRRFLTDCEIPWHESQAAGSNDEGMALLKAAPKPFHDSILN